MGGMMCRKKRLSESSVATVERCSCGKWHLHVGAITLRFDRDAFAELVHTLSTAANVCAAERYQAESDLKLLFGQLD